MTKLTRLLLVVLAVELAFCALVRGQDIVTGSSSRLASRPDPAPPPADICSGAYFYQRACDTAWLEAWPHMWDGHIVPAACSAHTHGIYGEDGKFYPIADQYTGDPNLHNGTYRRPPDAAPIAQHEWDLCYLPPHIMVSGYGCDVKIPQGGVLNYAMKTLAQVPEPMHHTFAVQYGCTGGGSSTPIVTARATTTAVRTPSRVPAIFTPSPVRTVGCDQFPGGPICPTKRRTFIATATRSPSRTTSLTATSTRTATASPSRPTNTVTASTSPTPASAPALTPTPTPAPKPGACGRLGGSTTATALVALAVVAMKRRKA